MDRVHLYAIYARAENHVTIDRGQASKTAAERRVAGTGVVFSRLVRDQCGCIALQSMVVDGGYVGRHLGHLFIHRAKEINTGFRFNV